MLDRNREGSREHHELPLSRNELKQLLHHRLKLLAEQLVRLVHDKSSTLSQIRNPLSSQIQYSPRRTNEDVDRFLQAENVVAKGSSAGSDHDLETSDFGAERLAYLGCLEGEFTGRDEDEGLDVGKANVHVVEGGDEEGGGLRSQSRPYQPVVLAHFTRSVLGTSENISPSQCGRYRLFLDRTGLLETREVEPHQQFSFESEVVKGGSLRIGDILQVSARAPSRS